MPNNIYIDEYGKTHIISKVLSSGGQGIVYRTENPNILLKLVWNPTTQEIVKDIRENNKFEEIRILPLIEKINLTLPQTVLRDVAGYTMKMLEDMKSFEEVFSNCENKDIKDFSNKWIEEIEENNQNLANEFKKYILTGGIRKRLLAYLKASCVLSKIHASGLVYCDVSDKNMFVSAIPDKSNVWLIDCDNLNYMKNIYMNEGWRTPGFGAPEVIAGKGNTMYSDAYSFAIALFSTLTNSHPFMGEAVYEALEEEDFLDLPEVEYACIGEFPWIGDREDNSNLSKSGIEYNNFVSKILDDCFDSTFSELGRKRRINRVTMPEWSFILAKELDCIVRCENCQMDYYGNETLVCPWCDKENKLLKVISKNNSEKYWKFIHEQNENEIDVPMRILSGFKSNDIDEVAFKINYRNDTKEIEISDLSYKYNFIIKIDGLEKEIYGITKFKIDNEIELYAVERKSNMRCKIEIEV